MDKKTEKKLALWERSIPRLNEEDLEFILDFSECFEPQIIEMVEARYKKLSEPSEDEEEPDDGEENMYGVVHEILTEMGCQSKLDRDGDFQFTFKDEEFFIRVSEERPFIDVWKYNWMSVSLDEMDKASLLRRVINETNAVGDIATIYSVDKDEHVIKVHCITNILFISYIPNRKAYLEYILDRFFDTRKLLEERLLKLYEEKQLQTTLS